VTDFPAATIDSTGIHVPDFSTVIAWMKEQYRQIYGDDIYIDNDSQDGQLIGIFALALSDAFSFAVNTYNSFSPSTAQGAGLSSVVKINGLQRLVGQRSTVDVTITGAVGTVIVNGIVSDAAGTTKWRLPTPVIIPLGGSIIVTAITDAAGAVKASPGTITRIVTPVAGWTGVTNAASAVIGRSIETDAELRARQAISTAIPSLTVLEGTIGAIAELNGVTRYRAYENDTSATDSDGIPPHSISLIIDGGDVQQIGEAIFAKKGPGCGTSGDTSVTVTDAFGLQNTVRFHRPVTVPITVDITIKALSGYNTLIGDKIKVAIAAAINALPIGDDVFFTRLYVPAQLAGPYAGDVSAEEAATFEVRSILIARSGSPSAADVTIAFNEAAYCDASTNIGLTVQ